MKKIFPFALTLLFAACGNQPIKVRSHTTENPLTAAPYPLARPVRLTLALPPTASATSYRVIAYMKCCKSPVDLKSKVHGNAVEVDVAEFWSPGIYVFEVIALAAGADRSEHEVARQIYEVTAQ